MHFADGLQQQQVGGIVSGAGGGGGCGAAGGVGPPWPDLQAPKHVTPQSVHDFQTLSSAASRGSSAEALTMADISQQTYAMSAHLRQVGHLGSITSSVGRPGLGAQGLPGQSAEEPQAALPEPRLEPKQVELLPVARCDYQESSDAAAEAAAELERQQQQQQQMLSNLVQMLQFNSVQGGSGEADAGFLQQTFVEIAKRWQGEGLGNDPASTPALAPAPAAVPGQDVGAPPLLNPWICNWAQPQAISPVAPAVATPPVAAAPLPSLARIGDEDTFNTARVEELNQYIRAQGQEYVEGQAEWSRQIAEVRSECLRELEKVKREKDEVERQARQEILRLQQRLREYGVKDDTAPSRTGAGSIVERDSGSPRGRPGAWAAAVSMDEHLDLQRKFAASEERIRQLEQYIKDQSAKQLLAVDPHSKEKDEEIQKLRQVVILTGAELRQVAAERQAVQVYQRKLLCWEQGARRLLGTAEQLLCGPPHPVAGDRSGEEGPLEEGRFGRTATKLSLTLTEGKDGEVSSLRRLLKDALKNNGGKDGDRKRKEVKSEEGPAPSVAHVTAAPRAADDNGKAAGGGSTTASPKLLTVPAAAPSRGAASSGRASPSRSSAASSRDTSPGGTCWDNDAAAPPRAEPAVAQVIARLACDLRQLLSMSQQQGAVPPPHSSSASRDHSPRSNCSGRSGPTSSVTTPFAGAGVGSAGASRGAINAYGAAERARVLQLVDSINNMGRKSVAQNIMSVEKMLRGLDRELRGQCEELFGEPSIDVATAQKEQAAVEEAKRRIPLAEDGQLQGLVAIRLAQQQSAAALAEFVALPQKLKAIFDNTKRLGVEVNALVPTSKEGLPSKVGGAGDEANASGDEKLESGVSQEEQLKTARGQIRQMSEELSSKDDRLRTVEQELVDMHVSRYNERAQCFAMLQHSAGIQGTTPWPWPWPGGAPGVGNAITPGIPDQDIAGASATAQDTDAAQAAVAIASSPSPPTSLGVQGGRRAGCQQAGSPGGKLQASKPGAEWPPAGIVA